MPTHLPSHLLTSFKKAYFEAHGKELDDEKANPLALYLLDTFGLAPTILEENRMKKSGIDSGSLLD